MKKTILNLILAASILSVPQYNTQAKVNDVDEVITTSELKPVKYRVAYKDKTIKNSVGDKIKIQTIETSNLSKNKKLQKKIENEIVFHIKNSTGEYYKNYKKKYKKKSPNNKIEAIYAIKTNKNKKISIRAKFYYVNGKKETYLNAHNFNYDLKDKNFDMEIEKYFAKKVNFSTVDNYLKKQTKKEFGKSVGYPLNLPNPYYFEDGGSAVFTYPGSYFGKSNKENCLIKVPKKYFK